jgi:integrase
MPRDRKQRTELELAKMQAALTAAQAEIARLKVEAIEQQSLRPGSALPGKLTPASINKLIKEAKETGRRITVADSENLGLQILAGGRHISWLFRWSDRVSVGKNKHKSRAIGLGSLRTVDIYQAREKALHYRQILLQNKDPKIEREKAICDERIARDAFKTVNQVADAYFTAKIAHKSISLRRKFDALLRPVRENIGNIPIQKVTRQIILDDDGCDLQRMWIERHKSAIELRSYIHRIIGYAKAMGWFEGENPATWRDALENVLPKSKDVHKVKHHPSMPYQDVPDFIPQLRAWRYHKNWHLVGLEGRPIPAYAVEMLILTGVRTKEVQRARYNEFDFTTMIWTVPAFDEDGTQRTKNGENHYLPITTSMVAIINEMQKVRVDPSPNAYVFPGVRGRQRSGRPINPLGMQTVSRVLRDHLKLDVKFVNHGFRSTLRTFCSAKRYPERWWDIQVGHTIGDQTRQAYPLEQLMEERRRMMQHWDDHCTKPKPIPEPKAEPKAAEVFNLSDKRRTA